MLKRLFIFVCCCCWWCAEKSFTQETEKSQVNIQHFCEADGFSESMVTCAIQTADGMVWLATWDGLRRYDGYRFTTFKAWPGDGCQLLTNRINYIEEAADHNIICRSEGRWFLFRRQTETFETYKGHVVNQRYRAPAHLKELFRSIPEYRNIELHLLLKDRQDGMWVYTHRGLERVSLSPEPLSPQKQQADASEEFVRGLFADKSQRLWTADKNGYIRVYAGPQAQPSYLSSTGTLSATPVRFGANAYCFFENHAGQICIGTKPNGLYVLTPLSDNRHYRVDHYMPSDNDPYSLNSDAIYDIREDSRHRLVLATYGGGLNIAEQQPDGALRFFHLANQLKAFPASSRLCRCLELLHGDTLLIGTSDGLLATMLGTDYHNMTFKTFRRQPDVATSLGNNYVMDILRTRSGMLLIATSGGGVDAMTGSNLMADEVQFKHYTTREGIASDVVMALAEDKESKLWLVAEASLCHLDIKTGASTNYLKTFFNGGFVFSEVPPVCLSDGILVMGTTQGLLRISPQRIAKSNYTPNIVFSCEQDVILPPGKQDFRVTFAAMDFNKNEDIVYAYKLDGIDQDWQYTRHNELNYVGLAPGTYTLHVKSTNGDGIWMDNEQVITLHRKARFNETPWAWMLYGLLLAVLLGAAVWIVWYIRRLQREIDTIKLTSRERISLLSDRIKELLPKQMTPEKITPRSVVLSANDQLFADRLKAYVEGNVANADLSVADIAAAMNVSRTVLFVRLRKLFDTTPNNYVLNKRIDMAKTLFDRGSSSVADVAYRCGFSDPKYFSRCFKKLTGKSPSEY